MFIQAVVIVEISPDSVLYHPEGTYFVIIAGCFYIITVITRLLAT